METQTITPQAWEAAGKDYQNSRPCPRCGGAGEVRFGIGMRPCELCREKQVGAGMDPDDEGNDATGRRAVSGSPVFYVRKESSGGIVAEHKSIQDARKDAETRASFRPGEAFTVLEAVATYVVTAIRTQIEVTEYDSLASPLLSPGDGVSEPDITEVDSHP